MALFYLLIVWWRLRWFNILQIVLISANDWLWQNKGISLNVNFVISLVIVVIVYIYTWKMTKNIWATIFLVSLNNILISLSTGLFYPLFERLAAL